MNADELSKKAMRILRGAKRQHGLCNWCKREMILPGQLGYNRANGSVSPRAATLDHLYGFHHPLRGDPASKHRNVIACEKCNRKRGAVENILFLRHGKLEPRVYLPDEDLRKQSSQ